MISETQDNSDNSYYLLEIDCTVPNIARIVNLDVSILNQLETEKNLCIPLNKIDSVSKEFRDEVKKGLNELKVVVLSSSKRFANKDEKELKELAEEIVSEYADSSQEDKDDINDDIKKIMEFHKEKIDKISESFKVEQLNKIIDSVKESGKLLKTFNHSVLSRIQKKQADSERLTKELTDKDQEFLKKKAEYEKEMNEKNAELLNEQQKLNILEQTNITQQKSKNNSNLLVENQNLFIQNQQDNHDFQTKLNREEEQKLMKENVLMEKNKLEINAELNHIDKNVARTIQGVIEYKHDMKKIKDLKSQLNKLNQKDELTKNEQQKIKYIQKEINELEYEITRFTESDVKYQKQIQEIKSSGLNSNLNRVNDTIEKNENRLNQIQNADTQYNANMMKYQMALSQLKNVVDNINVDIQQTRSQMQKASSKIHENEKFINSVKQLIKQSTEINEADKKRIEKEIYEIGLEKSKLPKLIVPTGLLGFLEQVIECLQVLNECQSQTQVEFMANFEVIQASFADVELHQSGLEQSTTKRKLNKMADSVRLIGENLKDGYDNLTANFKEIDKLSNINTKMSIQSIQNNQAIEY